ncbi:MAG: flagellar hook-length control protein FliK, partial [Betaproteobacteria bacterium]
DASALTAIKPANAVSREINRPTLSAPVPNTNAPLPGVNALQAPAPTAVAAHVEQLAQPLGTPAWDDGLATRVVWMARNDVQSAEIRLNPAELGPIEIKLTLTNDAASTNASANVQFSALHAATREAIESALPRLREMLQAHGIALGQASVDAGSAGQSNAFADSGRQFPATPRIARGLPAGSGEPTVTTSQRRGNGLVDTFA